VAVTFFYCTNCGAMNVKNIRDTGCPVCKVEFDINFVTFDVNPFGPGLSVEQGAAPHTKDTEDGDE
jgi:hypothetical protein